MFNPKDRTKRNSDALDLGEAISQYLKFFKIDEKYHQTALVNNWEKIMGKTIATRTEKLYVHKKILFLKLNSSALKNEMFINKLKVIELINKELGAETIIDIKLL
ncbi:MAG: DUF721 domain-containing protein [Cytophagales bacterium]